MFEVKVGDVLSISWRTSAGRPHQNCFSLVYYNGTFSEIPMVFIVMGVCGSEINLLTLSSLYCEEVTELMGTTKSTKAATSTNQKNVDESKATVNNTNVIIGVVISCSLLLLAVITIITIFVVRRNKKKSLNEEIHSEIQPTSVGEGIELDINEAYITNSICTESNVAYSTTAAHTTMPCDYDYIAL